MLNVAQIWLSTYALGPGNRSVVWVQGCARHCPGCISPEWIPQTEAWRIAPTDLAEILLKNVTMEGLTFSGGEPMLQAAPLTALIKAVRQHRDVNVICYSGYTFQELHKLADKQAVSRFLSELDVLIDGPYNADQNDNRGMRGSANQKVHYITDRLRGYDFETGPRKIEIHIQKHYTMMIGIPAWGVQEQVEQSIEKKGLR